MTVIKKPDLTDPKLRAKLAKGMGHNYYGEPAWPNDLLYIFPVVILGTFAILIGLGVLEPYAVGEPADPFATPLEILPEWYLFPTFNILRILPNKLLGIYAYNKSVDVYPDKAADLLNPYLPAKPCTMEPDYIKRVRSLAKNACEILRPRIL